MKWVAILTVLVLTTLAGLRIWRFVDDRSLYRQWRTLQSAELTHGSIRFSPELVADLPFYKATVDTVRFLDSGAPETVVCDLTISNN